MPAGGPLGIAGGAKIGAAAGLPIGCVLTRHAPGGGAILLDCVSVGSADCPIVTSDDDDAPHAGAGVKLPSIAPCLGLSRSLQTARVS